MEFNAAVYKWPDASDGSASERISVTLFTRAYVVWARKFSVLVALSVFYFVSGMHMWVVHLFP